MSTSSAPTQRSRPTPRSSSTSTPTGGPSVESKPHSRTLPGLASHPARRRPIPARYDPSHLGHYYHRARLPRTRRHVLRRRSPPTRSLSSPQTDRPIRRRRRLLEEFKLLPVLEAAAEVIALQRNQSPNQSLSICPIEQPLWLANLNTPEDFALAETHLDALDP